MNAYTSSDSGEEKENTYCIFLHIVEGIGFNIRDGMGDIAEQRKSRIILNASLNGVKFEVEGHSLSSETATIFNSNCIWECELDDIKRMKTDNRPVKLECFLKSGRSDNSPRRPIGSLLLPMRGIQILSQLTNISMKLHWHKLSGLSAEWRQNKPEIYIMLIIVKKVILESGELESLMGKRKQPPTAGILNREFTVSPHVSETSLMLQSQSNVYVQLLEQVGLIQVGNNPDVDCDIFAVTLTFKQVKNVMRLLELEQSVCQYESNVFGFHYDFLGSNSYVEIHISSTDCYPVNEKISLTFKSSLRSLRTYFQRIFYVPINLYYMNIAIANYRFDVSKFLPDDIYFSMHRLWTKNGTFYFDRLHKILSPRSCKPSVDFIFSVHLLTPHAKRNNYEIAALNEICQGSGKGEERSVTHFDLPVEHGNLETPGFKHIPYDNFSLSSRQLKSLELIGKYHKANSEPICHCNDKEECYAKSIDDFPKDTISEKEELVYDRLRHIESQVKQTTDIGVQIDVEDKKCFYSIAINTEPVEEFNPEDIAVKVVEELEQWKQQQMDSFLRTLAYKERNHIRDMEDHWEQQRVLMQARLDAKMAKCEHLNAQLEKAQVELKASNATNRASVQVVDSIKREIESTYTKKFQQLEAEMQRLKLDMQQRDNLFEIKDKQMQLENTRLEKENEDMKARTEELTKQLGTLQSSHLSADQLSDFLSDLRKQNERIAVMEKSRNHYKEQLTKASREINKLKLACLKLQTAAFKNAKPITKSSQLTLCLDEILNEEKDDLENDRQELNDIKTSLFISSESSSEGNDEFADSVDEDVMAAVGL
uniref:DUF3668 domain-containing protein n=1 Tax=Glossina austeni TaxID=7395 RepID=A0A1A9VPJ1_GLOAU